VLLGAGAAFAALSSIVTLSSPAALWAMANQLQLLLLLALTKSSLPDEVLVFITGSNFGSFSLDFLPIDKIPLVKSPIESLEEDQKDTHLSDIGVENISSFANNYNFLLFIILVVVLHGFVILLEK
jgi:hypothetical protein